MREDLDLVYFPSLKNGRMKTLAKTYSQEYQSISKRTTILQPSSHPANLNFVYPLQLICALPWMYTNTFCFLDSWWIK